MAHFEALPDGFCVASIDFQSSPDMEEIEDPENETSRFGRGAHFSSSLRDVRKDDEEETRHRRSWSGGLNVVEKLLQQFSPTKKPRSLTDELQEYHEKNQEFLRRSSMEWIQLQLKPPLSTQSSRRFQK
jgi:hypothetical protein